MFGFNFGGVRVDGFLLGLFGEGFEFEDEFKPDFSHVDVVFCPRCCRVFFACV